MWTVLFYVNPVTVALTVGVILAAAWAVARVLRSRPRAAALGARVCLACAAVVYLAVLVQPANAGWTAVGERATAVEWNPLAGYMQEFAPPDDHFTVETGQEPVYVSGRDDLTRQAAREIAAEEEADRHHYAYRFDIGGRAVWLDGEAAPLGEQERESLRRNGTYGIDPDEYLTPGADSATLVGEELVVNLLLFVPVGIVAAVAFTQVAVRLGTGAVFSVGVETSQLLAGAGGVVGTGDLIVNGTGGALGAGAVMAFSAFTARRSRPDRPSALTSGLGE